MKNKNEEKFNLVGAIALGLASAGIPLSYLQDGLGNLSSYCVSAGGYYRLRFFSILLVGGLLGLLGKNKKVMKFLSSAAYLISTIYATYSCFELNNRYCFGENEIITCAALGIVTFVFFIISFVNAVNFNKSKK